jgi:hydroxyethylthiazole kinase-like uncharacterized protein yjeF
MQSSNTTPIPLAALAFANKLLRSADANKADAGKVLLIGGSVGMAGALLLSAKAALHSGAGYTMLSMLDGQSAHALADQPELMIQNGAVSDLINGPIDELKRIRPQVIAIGPGLGTSPLARAWLSAVLTDHSLEFALSAIILDADALNLIASDTALSVALLDCKVPCVLTPHPGEAARLLHTTARDVQGNRIASLHRLIECSQHIVVLKGQHTLLGSPMHEPHICNEGNPSLAVGGSGDVLTGLIASLAAQGITKDLAPWEAACLGVQLHALAADRLLVKMGGPIGITPSELILEIRQLLNDLL